MERTLRQIRDEHLALRCQSGESGAFEELVRVMERPLLYFARTLVHDDETALDVLQAVWITAFQTVRKLEKPSAIRAWLYRIAHRKAVDRVRGDVSRAEAERRKAEENGEVVSGDEPAFDGEDARALHAAIAGLDRTHRAVIVLHFLEDLSVAEVAQVVGCPPGTVKSRIYHAKRALKEAPAAPVMMSPEPTNQPVDPERPLRERLLDAYAPDPGTFANYQKEVKAMLEHQEKMLRREKFGSMFIWFFVVTMAVAFPMAAAYGKELSPKIYFSLGVSLTFYAVWGAVELLKYFISRSKVELLKEIKGVELRLAAMEERLAGRSGPSA